MDTTHECKWWRVNGLTQYHTGEDGKPDWIITVRSNLDKAEDEASQHYGEQLLVCTWREDAQGLPEVPEGFEDAWCASISQE